MNWGFIDYENIGNLQGVNFSDYQRIFIFCGPKNSNIKLGDTIIEDFLKLEIIKLKTCGSNNLDFHISYYLGKFGITAPKEVCFHIISKDNGFDGLINHIKKSGRDCKKVIINQTSEKPKVINLTPCAELTVQKLLLLDGRKRPRKEKQLSNWIESHCRSLNNEIVPKNIVNELVKNGLIIIENQMIKYILKR